MINRKELFIRYRQKKLTQFYSALEENNQDILMACRLIGIDYPVLINWMSFEPELKEKIMTICNSTGKDILALIDKRYGKKEIPPTPEIIQAIFISLEHGSSLRDSCKFAGVSSLAFYRWCKENPALKERYQSVLNARVQIVENIFYQRLLDGKADTLSYIFFLTNRLSEHWKNRHDLVEPQTTVNVYNIATTKDTNKLTQLARGKLNRQIPIQSNERISKEPKSA